MSIFDIDHWKEIREALFKNKVRTFLTAFGVFWGIFMLILMTGAGKGLENGVTRDMGGVATNSVFMWTQSTSIPYAGFPRGRWFQFDNEDTRLLRQELAAIEYLAPRNQLGGWQGSNNVVRGKETGAFSVYGDYPDFFKIKPSTLIDGRILNQADLDDARKVCVIGNRTKEMLFQRDENPIGEYIRINGVYFMVVGWIRFNGSGSESEEDDQSIFTPFTTFQRAFNYGNGVGWFAMTADPGVPVSALEEKAKELLRRRHTIHPDDDRAIGSWNAEEEFSRVMGLFNGIRYLSITVGLLTLLAGAIGVSNIMLVVVRERTREIGVRRAVGATPLSIMAQIVMEATILTALAGMAGIIAGVWALAGLDALADAFHLEESSFTKPSVRIDLVLQSLLFLILAGVFAGIIPARRALSIKPVEALRYE
jgi:putative ABC transport system permease protein